ncbi:MAG TPA: hypothetical protein VGL91_11290 [Acidobacteriota bacterium]
MERQMEFLADHQAQFFASIQAHQQEIEGHTEQIKRHTEQILFHSEQIAELRDFLSSTFRIIDTLAGVQRQAHEDLTRAHADLARAEERTDERLNVLIGVVQRYFGET